MNKNEVSSEQAYITMMGTILCTVVSACRTTVSSPRFNHLRQCERRVTVFGESEKVSSVIDSLHDVVMGCRENQLISKH